VPSVRSVPLAAAILPPPHITKLPLQLHLLERVDGDRHAIAEIAPLPAQSLARVPGLAAVAGPGPGRSVTRRWRSTTGASPGRAVTRRWRSTTGAGPGSSVTRRRRSAGAVATKLAIDVVDAAAAVPRVGESRPPLPAVCPPAGGDERSAFHTDVAAAIEIGSGRSSLGLGRLPVGSRWGSLGLGRLPVRDSDH